MAKKKFLKKKKKEHNILVYLLVSFLAIILLFVVVFLFFPNKEIVDEEEVFFEKGVVAIVNDLVVSEDELLLYEELFLVNRSVAFDRLIDRKLLVSFGLRERLFISEEELLIVQNSSFVIGFVTARELFVEETSNFSQELLNDFLREELLINRALTRVPGASISSEQALDLYEAEDERFMTQGFFEGRKIVLSRSDERLSERVFARVYRQEDFCALVKQYSVGSTQDCGFFTTPYAPNSVLSENFFEMEVNESRRLLLGEEFIIFVKDAVVVEEKISFVDVELLLLEEVFLEQQQKHVAVFLEDERLRATIILRP